MGEEGRGRREREKRPEGRLAAAVTGLQSKERLLVTRLSLGSGR